MIPSHKWFPRNLGEQAQWTLTFASQLANVGPSFGISPAEIDAIANDAAALQWMAQNKIAVEAYRSAAISYRKHMSERNAAAQASEYPQPPEPPPPGLIVPGIFARIDAVVRRVRVANGYSESVGALLNIIPVKPAELVVDDAKPNPSLSVLPWNVLVITFVRGGFDGIEIQMKIDKDPAWSNAGRFYRSPININVPAGPNNLPRAVEIRARYLRGNDPVGQYSDVDTISTTP
jgi:hypothetical protein